MAVRAAVPGSGVDSRMPLLESTAFGAALVFGFRHGFDWDHLAALSDLTGSQPRPRRALFLATLYALGHAVMVLLLGGLAILFAAQVPDALDEWMGRLVGASLIALGTWIAWTAWRTRGAPPPRSRWMLLIGAVRRGRARRLGPPVVIEHEHPHTHPHGHGHDHAQTPAGNVGERLDGGLELTSRPPSDAAPAAVVAGTSIGHHRHRHRHVLRPVPDPFMTYGTWSSFGIGLLHGVGAETPTQLLVFAAAADATDHASALGVLVWFLAGLLLANSVVALSATYGYRRLGRRPAAMGALAALTAACSIGIGTVSLLGRGDLLPSLFT